MKHVERLQQAIRVIVLVTFASACELGDVLERGYDSRGEVVGDGAIKRGWIPEWIPESARDIREVHNIDTNVSQLMFAYAELDHDRLAPACHTAEKGSIVFARSALRRWWPDELVAGSVQADRFSLFACTEPHAFAAIDAKNRKAYFWREHSR